MIKITIFLSFPLFIIIFLIKFLETNIMYTNLVYYVYMNLFYCVNESGLFCNVNKSLNTKHSSCFFHQNKFIYFYQ